MNINTFEVSIYGNLVPFEKNPLLSLARVRIFYKGLNRNRTFITDEFAEKLISSLPYTPISGIWDENDFTDHGESREEGRIYGIVPEQPNGAWEEHLDKDGVSRSYYCCDVVLFTTRYKDAAKIIDKPQSMELYQQSIKGEWVMIDGIKCYRYTDGCFIGLQVLGSDVEPCFEGAGFFAYANSLREMINILNYSLNGGNRQMELNFKLSDRDKRKCLSELLNPNFNEQGNWEFEYDICDIYDDYAIVFNGEYFRCYYTKNDEDNSIAIDKLEKAFIVDVSEAELKALNAIKAANGGNFAEIDTKYQSAMDNYSTLKGEKETADATIATLEADKAALQETVNNGAATINSLNEQINTLNNEIELGKQNYENITAECNELKEFKANIDKQEKLNEIAKYSMLSEEVISEFTEKVDNYTINELQNELKIAYVNANANTIFTNNQPNNHLIYSQAQNTDALSGAARLINNHKKNGGNK